METIKVKAKSPYGVLVDKTWYNFPKGGNLNANGFVVGGEYDVDVIVNAKGGKIIAMATPASGMKAPTSNGNGQEKAAVTSGPTKFGKPLSQYEIDQNNRIHIQGIVQSLLASPVVAAFVTTPDDLLPFLEIHATEISALVRKIAEEIK